MFDCDCVNVFLHVVFAFMYVEMFICCEENFAALFPIHIWLMMMVVMIVYGFAAVAVVVIIVVVVLCCLHVSTLILKDIPNPWVWTYIGHWAKNFQYKQ